MIEFVRFTILTIRYILYILPNYSSIKWSYETNLSYLSYKLIQIYNYYNRTKEII